MRAEMANMRDEMRAPSTSADGWLREAKAEEERPKP